MSRKPIVGTKPPPRIRRPVCPQCGKHRVPELFGEYSAEHPDNPMGAGYSNARRWTGRYRGYGFFCTLTCAAAYANAIVRNLPTVIRRKYDV